MRSLLLIISAALLLQAQPRYDATRVSLARRPTPQWFSEARFGIFVVWGPYSVPSFAPKGKYAEWYWRRVEDARKAKSLDNEFLRFHDRVYGPGFRYEDFVPMFKAEFFDGEKWADLIARSGAKYVVHSAKYHDGFAMWPSEHANRSWGKSWNSVTAGPKRDLVGELDRAGRKRGLKMGLYYSLYEWYNPLYVSDFPRYVTQHHIPQVKDMVTRYRPDIVWADGQWEHSFDEWRSAEFLAWLFNDSPVARTVAVNDRWGGRRQDAGYYVTGYKTSEYERGFDAKAGAWEENRGMGASYGYNRYEDIDDYRTARQLIRLLVEMASQGGNLLVDIGPTADGRIPVIMQQRMVEMGDWLKVNGEAIYGSSAGPIQPEIKDALVGVGGPDRALSPAEEERLNKARAWASTAKPGKLFIHVFDPPPDGELRLPPAPRKIRAARYLDGGHAVRFRQTPGGVTLALPDLPPGRPPVVVVLDLE